jgi:transposase InsO family protein
MTSQRVRVVLAMEIRASWPTAIAHRPPAVDRGDGRGQSHLGRGTDCLGIAREVGYSCVAPDDPAVHGSREHASWWDRLSDVEYVVRNHASAVLACDFFVTVTATFRVLYVFVVLEVGTRRILHWNVTEHPTADWTAQAIPDGRIRRPSPSMGHSRPRQHLFRGFRCHGGSHGSDDSQAPVRAPQANAFCERLIGTIRRECLDWLILLNERHLRNTLKEWAAHYHRGRPDSSLGPGIPDPPSEPIGERSHRHRLPGGHRVTATPILRGLHHEYALERAA